MGSPQSIEQVSESISGSIGNGVEEKGHREDLGLKKQKDGTENNVTPVYVALSESGSQDNNKYFGFAEVKNSGQSQTKVEQPRTEITDSNDSYNKSDERRLIDGQTVLNNHSDQTNGTEYNAGPLNPAQEVKTDIAGTPYDGRP